MKTEMVKIVLTLFNEEAKLLNDVLDELDRMADNELLVFDISNMSNDNKTLLKEYCEVVNRLVNSKFLLYKEDEEEEMGFKEVESGVLKYVDVLKTGKPERDKIMEQYGGRYRIDTLGVIDLTNKVEKVIDKLSKIDPGLELILIQRLILRYSGLRLDEESKLLSRIFRSTHITNRIKEFTLKEQVETGKLRSIDNFTNLEDILYTSVYSNKDKKEDDKYKYFFDIKDIIEISNTSLYEAFYSRNLVSSSYVPVFNAMMELLMDRFSTNISMNNICKNGREYALLRQLKFLVDFINSKKIESRSLTGVPKTGYQLVNDYSNCEISELLDDDIAYDLQRALSNCNMKTIYTNSKNVSVDYFTKSNYSVNRSNVKDKFLESYFGLMDKIYSSSSDSKVIVNNLFRYLINYISNYSSVKTKEDVLNVLFECITSYAFNDVIILEDPKNVYNMFYSTEHFLDISESVIKNSLEEMFINRLFDKRIKDHKEDGYSNTLIITINLLFKLSLHYTIELLFEFFDSSVYVYDDLPISIATDLVRLREDI